jgi:hypothetical protein
MSNTGYSPTRDQMVSIVAAARDLLKIIRRWQKYAHLPGFPVERGNETALAALLSLERSLNPHRFAWGHKDRGKLPVRNWGIGVADGVSWLCRLLDLFMAENKLETMAAAEDFDSWAACCRPLPQIVTVREDELRALQVALRWLPKLDSTSETGDSRALPPAPLPPSQPEEAPEVPVPVVLISPSVRPFVLGRSKTKLTPAQFRVVKALMAAGEAGLTKARLLKVTGDAINVLKRLAKSDEDWAAVIHLPGQSGRRYRLGIPADTEPPIPPHTALPTPPHTSPHRSK